MLRAQVLVIDPAVKTPELDCFNRMALDAALPLTYHLPAMFGMGSILSSGGAVAGIVVLGSASSVHDGHGWQRELGDYLKARMEKGTPTLGLCFGHQLIAHLYGGKVAYATESRHKYTGFRKVHLGPDRLWGAGREGKLVVSHNETVVEVPPGFRVVGTSPEIKVEAMAHERLPIWTFQPHPEATPAFQSNRGMRAEAEDEYLFGHSLVKLFLDFVDAGGGVSTVKK